MLGAEEVDLVAGDRRNEIVWGDEEVIRVVSH